jgi:predicted transposase YdaD
MQTSFDSTFKVLVDHSPGDWARFLFGEALDLATTMDTSLHETSEVVDRLIRVTHADTEFIVHVEFHAGHSGNAIPNRLFHYNAAVMKRYALTTLSCVLILRKEADSPSISGSFVRSIEPFGDIHSFRYHPIRLWKEPLDRFLIPGSSLAVAGVLADFGERTLEEAGAEIRRCIDEVSDPGRREDMLYHLVVLAGMRFNRSQAESIFGRNVSVLEKYSVTLQYFIREGEERGQRNLLLASVGPVFGAPPQDVIDKVNAATSEKLLIWSTRLRTAQSWSELITD